MDSLRIASSESVPAMVLCDRCGAGERRWDRINGKAYCPNCQELLAVGEAPPLVEKVVKNRCAVCDKLGTVCFQTYPLKGNDPVEMDLCGEHIRGLLARRLGPGAFHQLRRRLSGCGISVEDVFLLHGAFYDSQGHALQPAIET